MAVYVPHIFSFRPLDSSSSFRSPTGRPANQTAGALAGASVPLDGALTVLLDGGLGLTGVKLLPPQPPTLAPSCGPAL
eukprot:15753678-Heterocapsa_arctica.AAC.1